MSLARRAGIILVVFAFSRGVSGAAPALTEDQEKILASARTFAIGYTDTLPNFICSQITRRETVGEQIPATIQARGRTPVALPQPTEQTQFDRVVEQLTYFNQRENYQVVSINGKPAPGADHMQLSGAISAGEFGSALRDIFAPSSGTEFSWDRMTTIRGRHAYVFKFRVPKESGIEIRDQVREADVLVAYAGTVAIDAETGEVLHMTSILELPAILSITGAQRSIDYEPVTIADKKYTLPTHSEVVLENHSMRYVNRIEFKDYRKFGAESMIHYDDPGPARTP